MTRKLPALGIALGLGTALALPAYAGTIGQAPSEPVIPAPAPQTAPPSFTRDWTGAYGGLRLGFGETGRDASGDGPIGGVHLGYLQDFGDFAAGVEGSLDLTDIGSGVAGDLQHIARLGARAGVTTGDFFFYGTAGGAQARISGLGSDTGLFGGIGVEYALDDNWRLGGEVLHHRFNNFNGSGNSVSANTAQLRASFRF